LPAVQGLGTPAPVAPTQKLVITGLYRYVRNPMYLALSAVILGQALLFGDWRLICHGVVFFIAYHVFVVSYEEPKAQQTYRTEYDTYRANVPHWVSRLTPGLPVSKSS
jgi:protein-S-isoprenylcysteine O-methyltransferase Ste14